MPHMVATGAYRVPGALFRTKVLIVPSANGDSCGLTEMSFPGNCPEIKAACPDTLSCSTAQTISKHWLMSMYRDHLSPFEDISARSSLLLKSSWDLPKASVA